MFTIHPVSVHLPIAFLLIIPVIDLLGVILRKEGAHTVATGVLALAVPATAIAAGTGLFDGWGLALTGPPHSALRLHSVLGFILIAFAVLLLAARLLLRRRPSRRTMLFYGLAELVAIWSLTFATGSTGGQLVYHYGVGTELRAPDMRDYANITIADTDLSASADGTYTGDVVFDGFEYAVQVAVRDNAIAEVRVTSNRETSYARMAAKATIPAILASQNANVDAVTGATATSKALMKAVERAIAGPVRWD